MDTTEAVKIALHATGCIDVDAALKVGDFSAAKATDPGSVAAAVKAFAGAKPYLFQASTSSTATAPAVEPATARSALDMTDAEYRAARWRMRGEAEQQRRASLEPNLAGKSALEMTDAEYEATLRRPASCPTYSMSAAPGQVAAMMDTRGTRRGELVPSGGAALLNRRSGHRSPEPTWGGLHLRNRTTAISPSWTIGRS